jgi:NAD(P)-dependent dehydrogenase (short-subunit alcohol dehydrogenase family)
VKEKFDMNLSFQNKVALVTGAGSGMGLVTARAFGLRLGKALSSAERIARALKFSLLGYLEISRMSIGGESDMR